MSEQIDYNFHAIIGPNGMCMCGVKEDGTVVTCSGLMEAVFQKRLSALPGGEAASCVREHGEAYCLTHRKELGVGYHCPDGGHVTRSETQEEYITRRASNRAASAPTPVKEPK